MIAECLVVEVRVTGDDCPLAQAARETGVAIDARPPQLRTDDNALLQFSTPAPEGVDGTDDGTGDGSVAVGPGGSGGGRGSVEGGDRVVDPSRYGPVAETLDRDDRIRYLHASVSGDRVNYRCLSKRPCVVHELIDAGLVVESLSYRADAERHTGAVVGYDVLEGVLAAGGDPADDAGVAVERIYPLGGEDDHPVARRWSITPAQEEALRVATEMGYFSVPREADAGEVAARLGISKSAFLERLRRGQGTLFRGLFPSGDG